MLGLLPPKIEQAYACPAWEHCAGWPMCNRWSTPVSSDSDTFDRKGSARSPIRFESASRGVYTCMSGSLNSEADAPRPIRTNPPARDGDPGEFEFPVGSLAGPDEPIDMNRRAECLSAASVEPRAIATDVDAPSPEVSQCDMTVSMLTVRHITTFNHNVRNVCVD